MFIHNFIPLFSINLDIRTLTHQEVKYVWKGLIEKTINIGSGYGLVPSGTKP